MSAGDTDSGHILVVDDLRANTELLSRLLTRAGYTVSVASNGRQALEQVALDRPDLLLMDIMMPEMDGIETCTRIKRDPSTRLLPVVLVTGLDDPDHRIRGIEAGADDFLTKPVNPHELMARVRSLVRLKRFTDDLESAESMILTLALTIEARDPYTEGHCQRLSAYATAAGRHIGLGRPDLEALHRGGYLHDVGKIGIPDAILRKRSRLTSDEFEQMKQHTVIGDRLCGELRSLRSVKPIVRHHHERLDGSGYPDGLAGDDVPLLAQIMGIVDVFDALTTKRPYRSALTPRQAFGRLRAEVRRGWRRVDLVEALASAWDQGELNLEGGRAAVRVHLTL